MINIKIKNFNGLLYGDGSFSTKDFKKHHAEISSIRINKVKYSLFSKKGDKEYKKIGYSEKFISSLLQSTIQQKTNKSFYYDKNRKQILLLSLGFEKKEGIYSVEISKITNVPEEDIDNITENFFIGEQFTEISGSIKEVEKRYDSGSILLILLLLSVLVLLFGAIYMLLFEETTVPVVEKQAPPMPIQKPLTEMEKYELKNIVSNKVLRAITKEIDFFENRKEFDIIRINTITLNSFSEIPFSTPVLNKDKNIWEYPENLKKLKRGGIKVSLDIKFQKKYPSNGYNLELEGNEKSAPLYTKTKHIELQKLTENLDANRSVKKIDKLCMESTLNLINNVYPYSQNDKRVFFYIKKSPPSEMYKKLTLLSDKCPLEISTLAVRGGNFESKISLYKGQNNGVK